MGFRHLNIKDIVEEIQIIAYNQALADVIEKREWLIGDDYESGDNDQWGDMELGIHD